jgi:hypothetical protein
MLHSRLAADKRNKLPALSGKGRRWPLISPALRGAASARERAHSFVIVRKKNTIIVPKSVTDATFWF